MSDAFSFDRKYKTVADALKAKHGDSAALAFYEMLADYALDGKEPDAPGDYMLTVWEHLKPMVDGGSSAPVKKPDSWGKRSIEDLTEDELRKLWKLYSVDGARYNDLKKKYGLHSRALNGETIMRAVGKLRRKDLAADDELLSDLASYSGLSKEEWLENIADVNVEVEELRNYMNETDPNWISPELIGFETHHHDDYWGAVGEVIRRHSYERVNK